MKMQPKFDLWMEKDGKIALNMQRIALLKAVHQTGSISAAARHLGLQYRAAWMQIRAAEEGLEKKLLETSIGGFQRGGARLTHAGLDVVERFEQFSAGLDGEVVRRYRDTCQT